jgi:hypothetical protein
MRLQICNNEIKDINNMMGSFDCIFLRKGELESRTDVIRKTQGLESLIN